MEVILILDIYTKKSIVLCICFEGQIWHAKLTFTLNKKQQHQNTPNKLNISH